MARGGPGQLVSTVMAFAFNRAELAVRRPDPSGDPAEGRLSGYALDELAVSAGIPRHTACARRRSRRVHDPPPQLLAVLGAGIVSVPAEQMAALSTDTVMGVSARATTTHLGRIARDLVQRIDPDAARPGRARTYGLRRRYLGKDG